METVRLTLGEVLARDAVAFPEKVAVVDGNRNLTYRELNELANQFAFSLMRMGVKRGDKFGIWMPNNIEWVIAWFGLGKIGAVIIPLDTWYKAGTAEYILGHSDAVGCAMVDQFGSSDYIEIMAEIRPNIPGLRHVIVAGKPGEGHLKFDAVLEDGKGWASSDEYARAIKEPEPDDLAFILYTSGTTGKPKGAMLTHYNIVRNAHDCGGVLLASRNDALIIPVPYSHCFGNVLGITLSAVYGMKMIPMVAFDPEKALQLVEREKATMIHGVPTMFIRELDVLKRKDYDLSTLRTGIIAGAPCPIDTMEGIINEMGCNVSILYGLTEVSPGATMTRLDDDIRRRVETVGRALQDVEVRVVDDNHNEVPTGEIGEIAIRGYNVMQGYYKAEEATAKTIDKDGWLYSGDLGRTDKDGYFYITGRKKDMIIVGGANVYPREIEEHLITHPKIQEVAVIGVPDHDLGEVVGAAIIPETGAGLTAQEVVDFCYGTLASNNTPRYVWISNSLPISGRGKVQKYKLREQFAKGIEEGNANIHKVVPTAVKLRGKAQKLMPIADALIEKGVVKAEKKEELTRFLLGIGEDRFHALVELMA